MKDTRLSVHPVRFAGLFLLALYLVSHQLKPFVDPLNRLTAYLAWLCLFFLGQHPSLNDCIITLGQCRVAIIDECTAIYSALLLAAFICSVPVSVAARLGGIFAGIPFLVTVNTVRIALVVMVGAQCPDLFDFAHVYLAQIAMVILDIAFLLAWLRAVTPSAGSAVPFMVRTFGVATMIFLPWLLCNQAYMGIIDRLAWKCFALAGYRLFLTETHPVYFQTFNSVLYLAMIVADVRLTMSEKFFWAAMGGGALAFGHLLFRLGNILLTAFSWEPAFGMTNSLLITGEYALPLLLWLGATRHSTGMKTSLRESAPQF